MKKILFLAVVSLLAFSTANAQDWAKFGLKGKVLSVSSDNRNVSFSSTGKLQSSFKLEDEGSGYNITNATSTAKGITGNYDDAKVSIALSGGKISTLSYTSYGGKKNNTIYKYNSQGQLASVYTKSSWVETSTYHIDATASLNAATAQQQKYMQLAAQAAASGNMTAYAKYVKMADAAARKAAATATSGYNKTKSQSMSSQSDTKTFTDYEYDEIGNWVSRRVNNAYTERQTIVYEPEFYSEYCWKKIANTDDMSKVEEFANNSNITATYKQKAKDYWNANILNYVKNRGNNIDDLFNVANNSLAIQSVKDAARTTASEKFMKERVDPENDYAKLASLANAKYRGEYALTQSDRAKVMEKSNKCKADSLAKLNKKTDEQIAAQQYVEAESTARRALSVDPTNAKALANKENAQYQQVKVKEAAGSITEEDYSNFVSENPTSTYAQEFVNSQALLACSKFNKSTSYAEMSRVQSLPADAKTKKKVESAIHHTTYLKERGRFFNIGIMAEGAYGKDNLEFGAGVGFIFGYMKNFINVYAGAEYDGMYSPHGPEESGKQFYDDHRGSLSGARLTVPAVLRLNLVRKFDFDFYLGVGANFNFALNGYYGYADGNNCLWHEKDKKVLRSTCITPRASLGISKGRFFEFEVYGLYELDKSPYDNDYVEQNLLNKVPLDQTYVGNQLKNRLRIGMSFHFLF